MNIALFALRPATKLAPIIAELNPTVILTSSYLQLDKRFADAAIQLDEIIHFNNTKIDVVGVINEPNLNLTTINNFSPSDYVDRVFYTTNNMCTSSFYCKPNVFSVLSNLYKIDFSQFDFKNLKDNNTVELLTEKIFYLTNRLGIEIKIG
jgi:hypothetical protein